jgi:hypothetical protein
MATSYTWELPFGVPADLELHAEWGSLLLVPVEPDQQPRLELTRGTPDNVAVNIEKHGETVRVAIEPQRNFNWLGGWDCRATLYVPRDIRASIQTNAGKINAHDLAGCELGIKANAGKIELEHVFGLLHLAADAGSIEGRDIGGFLDVQTQAGSVRLEVTDLQPGEHRIRAAMGSVRVELARGMDVCIETSTQMGSVRNQYPSRQGAPARLILATEMGSVRVEEGSERSGPVRPDGRPAAYPPAPARPQPPTTPSAPASPAGSSAPAESPAATADKPPTADKPVDPELERILKMVEAGELSAQEADDLLQALGRT